MRIANLKPFCAFSMLGTIAIVPLLVLPAMVGVLVDEAGMTESMAGWTASINFIGGALIALLMAFCMHGIDLKKFAMVALVIAAIGDAASAFSSGMAVLFPAIRFLTGLASGAVYTVAVSAFARYSDMARGYGIFITLQFLVSGIGLYVLPIYSPTMGVPGMFLAMAALDLSALTLVHFLPGRAIDAWSGGERASESSVLLSFTTLAAVLGFGIFETANTVQFTYLERLGVSLAFPDELVATALLVASLAGIPGAFCIIFIGDRVGKLAPLTLGIFMAIAGLLILILAHGYVFYFISLCLLGFSWAFCLPYIQAIMAGIDPNGSVVAAGSFSSTIGGAAGPGLAALVIGDGQYQAVFLLAVGLFTMALAGFFLSQRRHMHVSTGT